MKKRLNNLRNKEVVNKKTSYQNKFRIKRNLGATQSLRSSAKADVNYEQQTVKTATKVKDKRSYEDVITGEEHEGLGEGNERDERKVGNGGELRVIVESQDGGKKEGDKEKEE